MSDITLEEKLIVIFTTLLICILTFILLFRNKIREYMINRHESYYFENIIFAYKFKRYNTHTNQYEYYVDLGLRNHVEDYQDYFNEDNEGEFFPVLVDENDNSAFTI